MESVEQILKGTSFENCKSEILKDGYNSVTARLTGADGAYVVHIGKDRKDSGSSLYNAYRMLKCLEFYEIDFVPRAHLHDGAKDVLIESFVDGNNVSFSEMDDRHVELFAQQLSEVHAIDQKAVRAFCIKQGFEMPEVQTPLQSIEIFGIERFEIVKELCPDQATIDWIQPKLDANILLAEKQSEVSMPGLRWGDIGGNFIMQNDALWFIDWEFSSLSCGHELSYIKIHSHPTAEQFRYLVEAYAKHSDLSKTQLYEEVNTEERITRVNDVIWAAMKWGQNKGDARAAKKYQELTAKRMRLYEELGTPSN
jgi:hypothetical protein